MADRKRPTTGAELRATRTGLGVSQAQLARDWGVSPRMIRKLETGGALPAGYRTAAGSLAGGRVIAPQRRTTTSGAVAGVRGPQGAETRRRDVPAAGTEIARYGQSTRAGATVRRVRTWVPFTDTLRRQGQHRDPALDLIHNEIRAAQARGDGVAVYAGVADENPGASAAGYDVIVVSGPDVAAGRRGFDATHDLPTLRDLDELADDAGLEYLSS